MERELTGLYSILTRLDGTKDKADSRETEDEKWSKLGKSEDVLAALWPDGHPPHDANVTFEKGSIQVRATINGETFRVILRLAARHCLIVYGRERICGHDLSIGDTVEWLRDPVELTARATAIKAKNAAKPAAGPVTQIQRMPEVPEDNTPHEKYIPMSLRRPGIDGMALVGLGVSYIAEGEQRERYRGEHGVDPGPGPVTYSMSHYWRELAGLPDNDPTKNSKQAAHWEAAYRR
ncbi:MAG: hypothetical protein WCT53_01345 [Candidatus Gracilibacteria bacterium]